MGRGRFGRAQQLGCLMSREQRRWAQDKLAVRMQPNKMKISGSNSEINTYSNQSNRKTKKQGCLRGMKFKRRKKLNTYATNIKVVTIFTTSPTIVIKFGASHNGVLDTNQFHQGWRQGSIKLELVHEYLCSDNFFNCCGDRIRSLQASIFFVATFCGGAVFVKYK